MTLEKAFLFTDARYFLQAEMQLDEYVDFIHSLHQETYLSRNWTLMKRGLPGESLIFSCTQRRINEWSRCSNVARFSS